MIFALRWACLFAATSAVLLSAVPQRFSTVVPGRNPQDSAKLLAADSSGNLFIVYSSPKTSAIVNIHVVKTNPSGIFLASFDFGGTVMDTPTAAAADPQGNLIVVGTTTSSDFPLVSPLRSTGVSFVTKVDSQLQKILFSTMLGDLGGGPEDAGATAVASDTSGNFYITGTTAAGFATTAGVLQPQAPTPQQGASIEHGYVMEISSAGNRIVFATYFSGSGFNCASNTNPCTYFAPPFSISPPILATTPTAIVVDSTGAVTIAGMTSINDLPVGPNAYSAQCDCTNLNLSAFVARLGAGGTQLEWGTYIPVAVPTPLYAPSIVGVPLDTISSIALDSSGDVVFGGTTAQGLPISTAALQSTFPSASSLTYAGYIAKLDSMGSKLLFSTYFGGAGVSTGPAGIAIDGAGTIWVTGDAALGTLPVPAGTPLLGENYIAGIAADGSSIEALFLVPEGGTGLAIQASAGAVSTLGSSGAVLISSVTVGASLLGVSGSFSYTTANAVVARQLITLYGIGIGPATTENASITGGIIGTTLGGVQLLFDGVAAALLYAGPNQINAIVPSAVAGQETTTISIVTPAGAIAGPTLPVVATMPQVLANASGYAEAINQDGTVASFSNAPPAGSIVSIFLTGGGAENYTPDNQISLSERGNAYPVSILSTNPQIPFPVETSLQVLYAGDAPGQPSGVIQVNFVVPPWGGSVGLYQVQIGTASATFSLY